MNVLPVFEKHLKLIGIQGPQVTEALQNAVAELEGPKEAPPAPVYDEEKAPNDDPPADDED